MPERSKLDALKKATEAQEHQAAKELAALLAVLERRKNAFEVAQAEIDSLKKKLDWSKGGAVEAALSSGDALNARQQGLSAKRLAADVDKAEEALAVLQGELNKAEERYKLAEEDLLEARVERKRVEHLLEQKDLRKRREKSAREEAEADDRAIRNRQK